MIDQIVIGSLSIGIVLCLIRAVMGPTIADRVVCVDTATTLAVALLSYLSVLFDLPFLIDVGIVFAMLSFVGTIAIARYLKGGLK